MNTSNHVDVVIAEGAPMAGWEDLADVLGDPNETVDVAPDPARRIIVVAQTKTAGAEEARERGFDPIAVVTPRSPHAAYGLVADDVMWSDALTDGDRAELEPHVLPSLATTQGTV